MNSMMTSHFEVMEALKSFELPEITLNDRFFYIVGSILQVAAAMVLTIRFKKTVKSTRSISEELEFDDFVEKFTITGKDSRQATVRFFSYDKKNWMIGRQLIRWSAYYFVLASSIVLFRIVRTTVNGLLTRDMDGDALVDDILLLLPLGYSTAYFFNIYSIGSATLTTVLGKKLRIFLIAFFIGWVFIYNKMYFTTFSAIKTTAYFTMMTVVGIQLGNKLSAPEPESRKSVSKDESTEHPLARVCEQFDKGQMSLLRVMESDSYMIYFYNSNKKLLGMTIGALAYVIYVPKSANNNEIDSIIFRVIDGKKGTKSLSDVYTSTSLDDEKSALLGEQDLEKKTYGEEYGEEPALCAFVSDMVSETAAFSLQAVISA